MPRSRHAADVVAAEVDQHQVFGQFFRVGQQFFRQVGILLRRLAARAGAGDGAHGDVVAFQPHQYLR